MDFGDLAHTHVHVSYMISASIVSLYGASL